MEIICVKLLIKYSYIYVFDISVKFPYIEVGQYVMVIIIIQLTRSHPSGLQNKLYYNKVNNKQKSLYYNKVNIKQKSLVN